MKAQAINIDFTIALALFLFTAAGTIAAVQAQRGDANTPGRSSDIADRLEAEITTQVFHRDLVMYSPVEVPNYPVDTEQRFVDAAEPGSLSFEEPAETNASTGEFVSVPDLRNRSLRMSYLSDSRATDDSTPPNDLSAQDQTAFQDGFLSNSELNLSLGGPGLEALTDRGIGRDLVRERGNVSIPGDDLSTQENELSASTLSGNLSIYNGSPEFIVRESPAKFRLKNLSTVYVLKDNRTLTVDAGFDRTFSTQALAVTESPSSPDSGGLAFAGNLSANVTNVTSGVDVELSFTDRLRARPVDGLSEGFKRSLAARGHAKFAPVERTGAAWGAKIADLNSLDDDELRSRLAIGSDLAYNISLGSPESVGAPPWNGSFDGTNNESGDLVLDTAEDSASYNQTYNVESAAVTRAVVSGVDRPEDVLLEFQIDTPNGVSARTVENGTQVFRFDTGLVESFEARFESSRTNQADGNWTVDSYQVSYGNALDRGATLPPRGDVDTETQVLPFVDVNGSISSSVLEVRTWN